jgi:hypothetical protein
MLTGAPAAPRAEPTACWKALFMDWADGHVGGTYRLGCYRAAIARMQGDRLTYGSAAADLRLLVNRSVAHLPRAQRATLGPNTPIAPWQPAPRTAGVGSTSTWEEAARLASMALLSALLVAWILARLRRR